MAWKPTPQELFLIRQGMEAAAKIVESVTLLACSDLEAAKCAAEAQNVNRIGRSLSDAIRESARIIFTD